MLVLSRKTGEKIMVGDDIVITVTEIMGGRVRIGIEAPRETVILRQEIAGRRNGDAGRLPPIAGDQIETREAVAEAE